MLSNTKMKIGASKGFSIVELMVAILIGLIILAGVIQVVITSKSAFLSQEDMSYIQENARYAVRTIALDIQNSGYWGCAGANPKTAMVAVTNADDADAALVANSVTPIESFLPANFLAGEELWQPVGADAGTYQDNFFVVRRSGGPLYSVNSDSGTAITLGSAPQIEAGDYLAVVAADCQRMGIFQAANVNGNVVGYQGGVCNNLSIKPTVLGTGYSCSDSANAPASAESYLPGATVMEYMAHAYFIQESGVLDDQPALKRKVLKSGALDTEEIALGVEDMQVLYGVVDNAAGTIRFYSQQEMTNPALNLDWSQVALARVSLVFRSQTETQGTATDEARTHLGVTYDDNYIRKTVTTTVQLRNRT